MKKQFIYIGVIVLSVMFFGFSLFSFLNKEEPRVEKRPLPKKVEVIKNTPPKVEVPKVEAPKEKAIEISMDDIFQVEEIPKIVEEVVVLSVQEREEEIRARVLEQLETRIDFIYRQTKKINTKKGILEKFEKMQYEDVFLSDMKGNTFYGSNDVEDIYARTIVLEQIQKVGKYGQGFIVSDVDRLGKKRYIFVKSLDLDNLYLGVDFYSTGL